MSPTPDADGATARQPSRSAAPNPAPSPAPLPDAARLAQLADYWRKRALAIGVLISHGPPDRVFLEGRAAAYRDTAVVLEALVGGIDESRRGWQEATLSACLAITLAPDCDEEDVAWIVERLREAFNAENNARGAAVLWEKLAGDLRAIQPRIPA